MNYIVQEQIPSNETLKEINLAIDQISNLNRNINLIKPPNPSN